MTITKQRHEVLGQIILTPAEVGDAVRHHVRMLGQFGGTKLVITQPLPVVTVEARRAVKQSRGKR